MMHFFKTLNWDIIHIFFKCSTFLTLKVFLFSFWGHIRQYLVLRIKPRSVGKRGMRGSTLSVVLITLASIGICLSIFLSTITSFYMWFLGFCYCCFCWCCTRSPPSWLWPLPALPVGDREPNPRPHLTYLHRMPPLWCWGLNPGLISHIWDTYFHTNTFLAHNQHEKAWQSFIFFYLQVPFMIHSMLMSM